jgi:hypothetical protein
MIILDFSNPIAILTGIKNHHGIPILSLFIDKAFRIGKERKT